MVGRTEEITMTKVCVAEVSTPELAVTFKVWPLYLYFVAVDVGVELEEVEVGGPSGGQVGRTGIPALVASPF